MIFWVNYKGGETFYSYTSDESTYSAFESQFYTYFNNFQLKSDNKWVWDYDNSRTVVWELQLENSWFYPFNYSTNDNTDFIFNMFRSFENFGMIKEKVGFFIEVKPIRGESSKFYVKSKFQFWIFKMGLFFKFFKYMFNHKIQKDWKHLGLQYFKHKLEQDLFEVKIYFTVQGENKSIATWKLKSLFNNFLIFKNYPLNQFNLNYLFILKKWCPWPWRVIR